MQRRTFLINTSKLGLSTAASSMILGCGGSSRDALLNATADTASAISKEIVSINTKQDAITKTYTKIQKNLDFSSSLSDFYANTVPEYTTDSLFNESYLMRSNNTKNLWDNTNTKLKK